MKQFIIILVLCAALLSTGCRRGSNLPAGGDAPVVSDSPAAADALTGTDTLADNTGETFVSEPGHYIFSCSDTEGMPVEGVVLLICNDEACMMQTSDASGIIDLTLDPAQYSVHVMSIPEGYNNPYTDEIITAEPCDQLSFVFTR